MLNIVHRIVVDVVTSTVLILAERVCEEKSFFREKLKRFRKSS